MIDRILNNVDTFHHYNCHKKSTTTQHHHFGFRTSVNDKALSTTG